jgi:hypothetical protein
MQVIAARPGSNCPEAQAVDVQGAGGDRQDAADTLVERIARVGVLRHQIGEGAALCRETLLAGVEGSLGREAVRVGFDRLRHRCGTRVRAEDPERDCDATSVPR